MLRSSAHVFFVIIAILTSFCLNAQSLYDQALLNRQQFAHTSANFAITNVQWMNAPVPLYGKLEMSFTLDGTWTNPFDPADIEVVANIRLPNNQLITVPCFYMIPYSPQNGVTQLQGSVLYDQTGSGKWCLRFGPTQTGLTKVYLRATRPSTGQTTTSPW